MPKATKRAVQVVLVTVVLQSIGFTLVLPSMYLYMTSLGGADSFYGVVVAIYSVGSLLGSMIFGWWYDHRPVNEPIVVAITLAVVGNGLYSVLNIFPVEIAPWLMFTSRFLVGFGSGSVAVCRAFCSEVTPIQNKVSMMAAISGAQGIGFVIGPAVGSALSFMDFHYWKFQVDAYTSPGILSAFFCLGNLILVLIMLRNTAKRGKKGGVTIKTDEPLAPVFIILFLFFAAVSVFAIFETDFTILSNRDFGWETSKNSIYFLVAAVISTAVYIGIGTPKFKKLNEKKSTIVGFLLLIIGMLSFIVYKKPVYLEDKLNLYQIIVGGVLFSVGYPIASTYLFGLYSKILNPKVQGSKMGWITAAGSLARMLGPIWASTALNFGDTILFGGTALFLVISVGILVCTSYLLVPHREYGKVTYSVDKPAPAKTHGEPTLADVAVRT